MGERIPGGAVEYGQEVIVDVVVRHEGDAVRSVGIEVDAGDVSDQSGFVALEEIVGAVVLVAVRTFLRGKNEVRVLIGFSLRSFYFVSGGGQIARGGNHGAIGVVAVEAGEGRGVLERH